MSFEVKKAKRQRRPLKIALEGLSGSGKTYTALRLAFAMRRAGIGKRIVVADSENESASLYDGVATDGEVWEYDVCPIPPEKQNPVGFTEVYNHLVGLGYDIVIIDSMTHAWKGALARVDSLGAANKGDKFGSGWKVVTPEQEKMMQTITNTRAHLITTTRVKGEYDISREDGRSKIKKVGLKSDQRDGLEYEYDLVVRLDPENHFAYVEKVRGCSALDGKSCNCPDPAFFKPLFDWWLSADAVLPLADSHAEAIRKAATLDALKAAYTAAYGDRTRLTDAELAALAALKDRRKAELAAAAPPQPTGTPPSPNRDELALSDLRAAVEAAILKSPAPSLAAVAAKYGAAVGWEWPKAEGPRLDRLTFDQLDVLLHLLTQPQPAGAK